MKGREEDPLQPLEAVAWTMDAAALRVTWVASRAVELLGHPIAAWLEDGGFFLGRQPLDDRGRSEAVLRAVAADGAGRRWEHRFSAANGELRWFRTTARGLPSSGAVVEVGGLMIDITEQKRTERALREAEERLRTVIDHAPIVLFALDRDGLFTLAEGRGLRALGTRSGAAIGRSVFEIYRGTPAVGDAVRRALAGEDVSCVEGVGGLWWETQYQPLRDEEGAVIGVMGVAIEITARRRAEQESARRLIEERAARSAAESAQRRAAFLAEASRLLADCLDYTVMLRNLAALAAPYFGDWCAIDLLEDGRLTRLAVCHTDAAKAETARALLELGGIDPTADSGIPRVVRTARSLVVERISDEQLQPDALYPVVGSRDEERLRLLRALGLRAYVSAPLLVRGDVLGAITFVSAQEGRHFEADELATIEELAHRVAVAIDNARLYRAAQEGVRVRDEFLSIASHELKTPLTSLGLAVQSLLRTFRKSGSLAAVPESVGRSILETAERQAKRMNTLVDNLLDVSRITAGRLELHVEEIDLGELVRDVAAAMQGDVAAARSTLAIDAAERVVGHWDRVRLEQVVTNLLSNAVKYGAGGPIDVTVAATGARATLTVRDRGIGIEPDRLGHIFQRFERAVSSRHYGGLGLGLYIVQRVLDALGGSVGVTSVPGGGSCFTVVLPCLEPGARVVRAAPGEA